MEWHVFYLIRQCNRYSAVELICTSSNHFAAERDMMFFYELSHHDIIMTTFGSKRKPEWAQSIPCQVFDGRNSH